ARRTLRSWLAPRMGIAVTDARAAPDAGDVGARGPHGRHVEPAQATAPHRRAEDGARQPETPGGRLPPRPCHRIRDARIARPERGVPRARRGAGARDGDAEPRDGAWRPRIS